MSALTITQFGATATLTLDQASDALSDLHSRFAIVPAGSEPTMAARLRAIRINAQALDIVDVGDLLRRANDLIREITGVSSVTSFHNAADAAKVHETRNYLAALAAAAYSPTGTTPPPSSGQFPSCATEPASGTAHSRTTRSCCAACRPCTCSPAPTPSSAASPPPTSPPMPGYRQPKPPRSEPRTLTWTGSRARSTSQRTAPTTSD
jgi:hypothetical protein